MNPHATAIAAASLFVATFKLWKVSPSTPKVWFAPVDFKMIAVLICTPCTCLHIEDRYGIVVGPRGDTTRSANGSPPRI